MITTGEGLYVGSPIDENYFLQFVKFMRQTPPNGPGWLIAGSCNNVAGTMGVDVINSINDIVIGTWVVLESPDRMTQLLFHVHAADSYRVYYNPNSDYAGGGVGVIPTTSTTDYLFYQDEIIHDNNVFDAGLHIVAEETFPYNFAVCCYAYNSTSLIGGMLFCRFETKDSLVGDHILIIDIDAFDRAAMTDDNPSITQPNPSPKAVYDGNLVACSWTTLSPITNSSAILYPDSAGYRSPDGQELFIPSIWVSGSTVLGTTNFIRWTPNPRPGISTYGNHSIVNFDRSAFQWDGSTLPVLDPKTSL